MSERETVETVRGRRGWEDLAARLGPQRAEYHPAPWRYPPPRVPARWPRAVIEYGGDGRAVRFWPLGKGQE